MSEFDFHDSTFDRFVERIYSTFELAGGTCLVGNTREAANVRRLQAFFRILGSGDPSPILISLAEDAVMRLVAPPEFPMAGEWHGPAEIGAAMSRNFSLVAEQAVEIERVVAQGDCVILLGQEQGLVRATGRRYDCRWVHSYAFRNNKLAEIDIRADTATMIKAFLD